MLIYNITFHMEDRVRENAVMFLINEYIPRAISDGILFNPRLCRIHAAHGESGYSYSVQFYVKNKFLLDDWQEKTGKELNEYLVSVFGNFVVGFSTVMEELDI